jgi:hypothetical protein
MTPTQQKVSDNIGMIESLDSEQGFVLLEDLIHVIGLREATLRDLARKKILRFDVLPYGDTWLHINDLRRFVEMPTEDYTNHFVTNREAVTL